MSEVIATLNPTMPKGYESVNGGIEVVQEEDGSLTYQAIIEIGEGEHKTEITQQIPDPWEDYAAELTAEYEAQNPNPEQLSIEEEIAELRDRLAALEQQYILSEVKFGTPDKKPGADTSFGEKSKERFDRLKGRVGFIMSGTSALAAAQRVQIEREGKHYLAVEEELYPDGYSERDRRSGGTALAAGVLAVGAAIVAYWLGTRTGHVETVAGSLNLDNLKSNIDEIQQTVSQLPGQIDHISTQTANASTHITEQINAVKTDVTNTMTAQHAHLNMHEHVIGTKINHQNAVIDHINTTISGNHSSSAHEVITNGNVQMLDDPGDTIWNHVQGVLRDELGRQPTDDETWRATNKVLNLNGLQWNSGGYGVNAHRLPVGFAFKMPDNLLA